jgi:hypothetical protein
MSDDPASSTPVKEKRKLGSILTELLLWTVVSITTAVLLVLLAEKFLPSNF